MAKNFFKKTVITGIAAYSFLVFGAALAASDNLTTSDAAAKKNECQLAEALTALLNVKDSNLSQSDQDKLEMKARTTVITGIIACSNSELDIFKKRLDNLNLKDGDAKDGALRDKLLGDIDAARLYFVNRTDELASNALDLLTVKRLAKDLSVWRDVFYAPALSAINSFALVVQNQQAIKTAKNRFDKISFSLSAVKLNEVQEIKKLLDDSDARLKKGSELNKQAHDLVWHMGLVSDSASSSPTSTKGVATGSLEGVAINSATSTSGVATSTSSTEQILPLVKDSLNELKKAYTDYILISNIVKKYLGL